MADKIYINSIFFLITTYFYLHAQENIRIMPLGDSITQGCCISAFELNDSYRKELYELLINDGYDIDFVGGEQAGTFDDIDHEGHDGWRADQIRDNIFSWLEDNPADIILLHIGTNDITQNEPPAQIVSEVEVILDEIDNFRQGIYVVLARIINRQSGSPATSTFNQLLQDMADDRIDNGDLIVVIDQESTLNYTDDIDGRHPNALGYEKMAQAWFPVIKQLLDDITLPVEISLFEAAPFSGFIQLHWITESELNILGFIIERRQIDEKEFTQISSYLHDSRLYGQGNNSTKAHYYYSDYTAEEDTDYIFRLTALHYDGSIASIRTALATSPNASQNLSVQIEGIPNPFNSTTQLHFSIPYPTRVQIKIFDSSGRFLLSLYDGYLTHGEHSVLFDASPFSGGMYFCHVKTELADKYVRLIHLK